MNITDNTVLWIIVDGPSSSSSETQRPREQWHTADDLSKSLAEARCPRLDKGKLAGSRFFSLGFDFFSSVLDDATLRTWRSRVFVLANGSPYRGMRNTELWGFACSLWRSYLRSWVSYDRCMAERYTIFTSFGMWYYFGGQADERVVF